MDNSLSEAERTYQKMRDMAAKVSEHFSDYILVVRIKDGLNWRMSDRTFAAGACRRLLTRLDEEDRLHLQRPLEDV